MLVLLKVTVQLSKTNSGKQNKTKNAEDVRTLREQNLPCIQYTCTECLHTTDKGRPLAAVGIGDDFRLGEQWPPRS